MQARLSAKQDRHYSSLGAVPGNNLELQAVDEERFTAAALFGLAGSPQGLDVLLRHPGQVLTGTTCKACIPTLLHTCLLVFADATSGLPLMIFQDVAPNQPYLARQVPFDCL